MVGALDAGHVTELGVGIILALVILAVVLGVLITALVARIVIAVVAVVLAVVVWQQRTSIEHKIDQKRCNLTFFGVHLDPPRPPDSGFSRCG